MKEKINCQIKNRERRAKKAFESLVNEREKSKDELTDKILNKTFEIKDVKYEAISNNIKSNVKRTWINGAFVDNPFHIDIRQTGSEYHLFK
jgi:hypothetical protein